VTLSFKHGDEQWTKLRKRAERDLYWFNSTILGYADKFPLEEDTHLLLHRMMQRKSGCPEVDAAPYQLIMVPRETGKTSTGTIGYCIWQGCKNPDRAMLIANEKQENANDFLASIKHHFETNELLRALFPEVIPPDLNKTAWSAQRATLQRTTSRPEPTFDTIGVGGTVVGRHYDEIICDDLVAKNAMENARSGNWSIMYQVNRWINQLNPLLSINADPFPSIRFIGTRWWSGDSYDHIEAAFGYGEEPKRFRLKAKTSTGKLVTREVYRRGDLAIWRQAGLENGKEEFPKIWSMERMEKVRYMDPEFYSCNIQNDPTEGAVRVFQDDWIRYWQYVDKGTLVYTDTDGRKVFTKPDALHKLISVDPAFTSGEEGARSAIVVLGTDQATGKHLVLEALAQHSDPKDTVTDILNCARNWGVTRVFVELAGQQLAFMEWLDREARMRGQPMSVEPLKPGGRNKALRIESLVVPFKNGDLFIHASQANLLDEYRRWRPGSKLQDTLDALAYAMEQAPKPLGGIHAVDPKTRARRELAAFHRRLETAYS
jgi:hypothetical protein